MSEPTSRTAGDELTGKSCPYCRFPFKRGVQVVVCGACGASQHGDCWHENSGCAVFGCEGGGASTSAVPRPGRSADATPNLTSASREHATGTPERRGGLRFSPTVVVLAIAVIGLAAVLLVRTGDGKTSAPQPQPATSTRVPHERTTPVPTGAATDGWPRGFAGFTVALASDLERSSAEGAVGKARSAGLPRVGMLVSANYRSLAPGYLFVFSGVYASAAEAQRYVAMARRAGFSDAYVRRVAE